MTAKERDILNEEFNNIENHTLKSKEIIQIEFDQGNRSTTSKYFGGKIFEPNVEL